VPGGSLLTIRDRIPLLIEFAAGTSVYRERDLTQGLPIVQNGPPGTFIVFQDGLRVSLPTDQIVHVDESGAGARVGFGGMRFAGMEARGLIFHRVLELHPEEQLSPARSRTMVLDPQWVHSIVVAGREVWTAGIPPTGGKTVLRRESPESRSVTVRPMQPDEARNFLEIHRAAVREIAAKDYSEAVVNAWAPLPITDEIVQRFLENRGDELRVVAEVDSELAGIGAVVIGKSELVACYVAPHFVRRGVGQAIVSELEQLARQHGLNHLQLESSVTAEPFYAALGYRAEARGERVLASGVPMAAVRMVKRFVSPGDSALIRGAI
jgi:putative acetyltransferase